MKLRAGSPKSTLYAAVFFALGLVSLSGCLNLFGFMDTPVGDDQILSRARGCFDSGDFVCAAHYYALLSTADGDARYSDSALAVLTQNHVGMGAFLAAFAGGTSSGGVLVTLLANSIGTSASQSVRLAIYQNAYLNVANISNAKSRGFIRFVTALALVAEILAEDGGSSLLPGDLVTDATGCTALGNPGCAVGGACAGTAGDVLQTPNGTVADLDAAGVDLSGAPTFNMIQAALQKIQLGLGSTELNVSASSALTFATQFGPVLLDPILNSPCYRYTLITNAVGTTQ